MSTSTELVTAAAEPPPPWIPPELIYLIISMLWKAPQTPQVRLAVLRNIVLVSRTWLTLVAGVVSRDVHITNRRNANAFLRLLPRRPPAGIHGKADLFSMEAHQVVRQHCHSLTFHVDQGDWIQEAVSTVLNTVTMVYPLPSLRHISLQYTDMGYSHVLEQIMQGHFPERVTHLSLAHSFADRAKSRPFDRAKTIGWLRFKMRLTRSRRCVLVPRLTHLSLSGVPTAFVLTMLNLCPNVETLDITHPEPLSALTPLPPPIKTLVLRRPGVALSRKDMTSWDLVPPRDRKLFLTRNTKPQIVVRSRTPDPVAFTELRRDFKRFNAELVYERDD